MAQRFYFTTQLGQKTEVTREQYMEAMDAAGFNDGEPKDFVNGFLMGKVEGTPDEPKAIEPPAPRPKSKRKKKEV